MTHTPGPWRVNFMRPHTFGVESVDGPGVNCIADCSGAVAIGPHGPCLRVETDVIEANARLIAAAPDLLAALDGLIENAQPDNWDDDDDPDQAAAWRAAFRAVCKARGMLVPKNVEDV